MIIPGIIAAGSSAAFPPLPDLTGAVWIGGMWNLNPVGYPAQALVSTDNGSSPATAVSPYPLNWADLILNNDPPPILLNTLSDQNGNLNDFTQSGASRPVVQVASSVVVTGIGVGEYTYRKQFLGYNYYGLLGQATGVDSDSPYAMYSAGDGFWQINNSGGVSITISDDNTAAFPNLATWTGSTVTAPIGSGWVQGSATTGMVGGVPLYTDGSATGTIELLTYIDDFSGSSVLFETGTGSTFGRVSVTMTAGVLSAAIYDDGTGPNSKAKTLSVPGLYNIAFGWNTTQVTPASQTSLKVNNSASGVTSPISTDCFGFTIGGNTPSLMARDAGGTLSLGFPGRFLLGSAFTGVKSAQWQTDYFTYTSALLASVGLSF